MMIGEDSVMGFVQQHTGVVLFFGSGMIACISFLVRENFALKKDRRRDSDERQSEQLRALKDLHAKHAASLDQTVRGVTEMSIEFRTALAETNREFRASIKEISDDFRCSVDSLHGRITDVAMGHAALLREHDRMLEICPVSHGKKQQ